MVLVGSLVAVREPEAVVFESQAGVVQPGDAHCGRNCNSAQSALQSWAWHELSARRRSGRAQSAQRFQARWIRTCEGHARQSRVKARSFPATGASCADIGRGFNLRLARSSGKRDASGVCRPAPSDGARRRPRCPHAPLFGVRRTDALCYRLDAGESLRLRRPLDRHGCGRSIEEDALRHDGRKASTLRHRGSEAARGRRLRPRRGLSSGRTRRDPRHRTEAGAGASRGNGGLPRQSPRQGRDDQGRMRPVPPSATTASASTWWRPRSTANEIDRWPRTGRRRRARAHPRPPRG